MEQEKQKPHMAMWGKKKKHIGKKHKHKLNLSFDRIEIATNYRQILFSAFAALQDMSQIRPETKFSMLDLVT